MTAIFNMTNGGANPDDTINLLSRRRGVRMVRYTPGKLQLKNNGYWNDSPIAQGRRMVNYQFSTVTSTLRFSIVGRDQDKIIKFSQAVDGLLLQAINYWSTRWQDVPVYLERRAKKETNTSYAIVLGYSIVEDPDIFNQPFVTRFRQAVAQNLTLVIEHTPWSQQKPNEDEQIAMASFGTYEGNTYGNVDSSGTREDTTDKVYIANHRSTANITHIYREASGTWTSNLFGSALPYNLLGNSAGDATYFGINTALSNSGPFSSLVFDLSQIQQFASHTLAYEIWTGSVWFAPDINDNTDEMTILGVNSIHWEIPGSWSTGNLNTIFGGSAPSVTGYWFRIRIATASGPVVTVAEQSNRQPYSITWPFVDILADQVSGDIPALVTNRLTSESDKGGPGAPSGEAELYAQRVIGGLRTYSRGADFTAYLNVADEQNPSGVTVTLGTDTSYFSTPRSANGTGRYAAYIPATFPDAMADRVTFTLDNTLAKDFFGSYRAFIRIDEAGSGGNDAIRSELRIRVTSGSSSTTTGQAGIMRFFNQIADFGRISMPTADVFSSTDDVDQIELIIRMAHGQAISKAHMHIYDLILIPVDEWAFDSSAQGGEDEGFLGLDSVLDIDSTRNRKINIRSFVRDEGTQNVTAIWQTNANGPAILQSGVRQRMWYFTMRKESDLWVAYGENSQSVEIHKNQRYTGLRGEE